MSAPYVKCRRPEMSAPYAKSRRPEMSVPYAKCRRPMQNVGALGKMLALMKYSKFKKQLRHTQIILSPKVTALA